VNDIIDETARPVPRKQPAFEDIVPRGMGLFLVLTMIASLPDSATYPKHYVDIATV